MDTNPTKQRQQFYRDYASGQWSMSELCDRYQISRTTHSIMLGNIRGTAADRPQCSPIDPWYNLALNPALRATRPAGRQLNADPLASPRES
jgi:hypothetical protein